MNYRFYTLIEDRWASVWLIGGVCIFYTTIGGLKAVVWTDTLQIGVMLAGFFAVIIKGSNDHGGYANLLDFYKGGGRNIWNEFSFDPRIRHTFWSIIIGGTMGNWGNSYCTSQSMVQRVLACKDNKNVKAKQKIKNLLIENHFNPGTQTVPICTEWALSAPVLKVNKKQVI